MNIYNNGEKYNHFNYEKKSNYFLLKFGTAGLVTYKMQKLTH